MTAIAPIALPRPDNAFGILCLCMGLTVFSVQDLILKLLATEYPLTEAMVLRSLTAFPLLLIIALKEGGLGNLFAGATGGLVQRGAILVAAYFAYYLAIPSLDLAKVAALYFTLPLFLTALAGIHAKKSVGWRRWLAVSIGFAGVPLVIGSDWQNLAWALPLLAGLAYAYSQLISRQIGRTQTASAMAFWANAVFLLVSLVISLLVGWGWAEGAVEHHSLLFLLRGWVWPSAVDALLMAGCGVIAALGLTLMTQSYRLSDSATIAPFEYTAMAWALFWGYLFFDEVPTVIEAIGMVIICAAGFAVLWREKARELPPCFEQIAADPPLGD